MSISQAEAQIMQVLWRLEDATLEQLREALDADSDWHESTIKTLLARLQKKGAVTADLDGRRFRYRPVLSEAQWQGEEARSFLDRVFGGQVAPLVAFFGERGELGSKDVAELKRLLQEMSDE